MRCAGTVTVGVHGGSMPELYVDDRGPGIPVEERDRVTDRFYRLPGTGGDGCGLGLAIVAEIARVSRASLQLDAGSSGTGLRASLRFGGPVGATTRTAPARASAPAESARAAG
jgi:two-component system sensor histidine kinase TctE